MKTLLGVLIACFAVSASPQALTKSQEGRVVVGLCYSSCTDRYTRAFSEAQRSYTNWTEIVTTEDFRSLDDEVASNVFAILEDSYCRLYSAAIADMQSCRDGCRDVEAAYSYRTSSARTRFLRVFQRQISDAENAELTFCEGHNITGVAAGDGPPKPPEPVKAPPRPKTRE